VRLLRTRLKESTRRVSPPEANLTIPVHDFPSSRMNDFAYLGVALGVFPDSPGQMWAIEELAGHTWAARSAMAILLPEEFVSALGTAKVAEVAQRWSSVAGDGEDRTEELSLLVKLARRRKTRGDRLVVFEGG
jgi:hypothetical protein